MGETDLRELRMRKSITLAAQDWEEGGKLRSMDVGTIPAFALYGFSGHSVMLVQAAGGEPAPP